MTMQLKSPAFEEGGMMAARFTCDSADVSPALEWSGAPAGTRTFAIVCDDPDAPGGSWVHWLIFNIPVTSIRLNEGILKQKTLENGARQGTNDFRRIGYGGPCPPSGVHRYFFRMYALDTVLALAAGATRVQLLEAMAGHILAETQLLGRYQR